MVVIIGPAISAGSRCSSFASIGSEHPIILATTTAHIIEMQTTKNTGVVVSLPVTALRIYILAKLTTASVIPHNRAKPSD